MRANRNRFHVPDPRNSSVPTYTSLVASVSVWCTIKQLFVLLQQERPLKVGVSICSTHSRSDNTNVIGNTKSSHLRLSALICFQSSNNNYERFQAEVPETFGHIELPRQRRRHHIRRNYRFCVQQTPFADCANATTATTHFQQSQSHFVFIGKISNARFSWRNRVRKKHTSTAGA